MATLRTVTKNTFLYTFSSVLQRSSSIIFFPIFSAYLTKGDYGIQSVVYFVTMFVIILSGMELSRTATRLIHEGDNVEKRVKEIYGTYFITIFSMNIFFTSLLLLVGPWGMQFFLNDIPFFPYIALTACTLPFVAVYLLYKSYLQATHQGQQFVKVDFLYFLSNVGFNLFFVIVFDMGAAGIILSTLVSTVGFSAYTFFAFFRHTRLSFNRMVLREGLRFSLPLVPFILLGIIMEWADKMVLNAQIGKDAGGILYIATMIAAFFTVLRESCNQALIPWFYQQYDKLAKDYVHRVLYAVFTGLAILAVCISWFSFEILTVLSSNPDLVYAYKYAPLIINTALVVFLSQLFYMVVMYFKINSRYLFITTLVGLPINVCLSLLLIQHYGIYGAAASNFVGMLMMTVTTGVLSHRSGFKMNYFYFALIIASSLTLSFLALLPLAFWIMFACKAILALTMLTLYYLYISKHFPINGLIAERIGSFKAMVQRSR